MTLEKFLVRCPDFAETDFAEIQACLDGAAAQLSQEVWGAQYDEGHAMLTAHLLALSPSGQNARLVAEDGKTTTFLTHFLRMQKSVCSGFRVA